MELSAPSCFKAYDIRGKVPEELDAAMAEMIVTDTLPGATGDAGKREKISIKKRYIEHQYNLY